MEELGQAHVFAKLECQTQKVQRDEKFDRICRVLRQVVQHLDTHPWNERHHQLVYTIHNILTDNRGAPWISQRQREVLPRVLVYLYWTVLHAIAFQFSISIKLLSISISFGVRSMLMQNTQLGSALDWTRLD